MNEQERRAEILKAEEAIRQLGIGLAVAHDTQAQAEAARTALLEVRAELGELRRSLDLAAGQVSSVVSTAQESVSVAATTALSAASARFNEAISQVPVALSQVERAAAELASSPERVAEAVKIELSATIAKLIDVSTAIKTVSQQLLEIKQALSMDLDVKLRAIAGSARWATVMATVAAAAAVAALLMHLR